MTHTARILYIQPSELFGGAERQAATLLPHLPDEGLEVTALVGPGTTIVDWLRAAGVKDVVHSTAFPRDWAESRGLQRLGRAVAFVHQASRLRQEVEALIARRHIDAVVAAMAFSWVAATPACARRGVPVIWRAGGMELSRPQHWLLPLWARHHPPAALICNSVAVRRMFGPLVPAPAYLVRNGVDTNHFRPGAAAGSELRPPAARTVIGFAGRLVPQKRPEDFLAMAHVIAQAHPDAHFIVAGDGSRRAHFETLANHLGLGQRMHFLGIVQDMRRFYAACDLLVLPSRSEGCPNIVLEAMAMKVPVIASDTVATREVVTSMRDGLLFPAGNVGALVEMVQLALRTPALGAALAARALRKVQGPLSAAASAHTLATLVHTLLGRHQAARANDRRMPSSGVMAS
jgi:glycosyltransferase involved in cell wall biosynthesis